MAEVDEAVTALRERDRPRVVVFKIMRAAEVAELFNASVFAGSPDDRRDGYVHLSAAHQLPTTLKKHFSAERELWLLVCDTKMLGSALRWESSRSGEPYPHLYRSLALDDVIAALPVDEGIDPQRLEEWSQLLQNAAAAPAEGAAAVTPPDAR